MDSLDSVVSAIQKLSGTDLPQLLTQLKSSEDLLQRSAGISTQVLSTLDPNQHSLGWLFILESQVSGSADPPHGSETFIAAVTSFIGCCRPEQIRLAPDKFASICKQMKEHALKLGQPGRVVMPLKLAIGKVQPSTEYLSPQHGDFFQVCLLAKMYHAAIEILAQEVYETDPAKTGLVPRDFLLFCYYGGMLQVGLKNFSQALKMFLNALTAPSIALNAITVASYKKYAILSLIYSGQIQPFPKYTASIVQRHCKNCCQEYNELANAYTTRNMEELRRCALTYEEVFRKDNNYGLVKQCIQSLYKRNIQRLTQTYLTLSIEDIAQTVGLSSAVEAESYILRMIESGDIYATINQKDGMVSFLEDPEQYNTSEMVDRIDTNIQTSIGLAKKVADVNEQVITNRTFLSKTMMKDRMRHYTEPMQD
ncbi:hypothetical protein CYMTET_26676 [Cymbomonas tetramitiformis]|uniref:COP9 signalosome complex subunit 3 n=1 Tax=Cymbomonas tetramitiformis TaxID=36881 RepID=A0AAE0KXN9_9CHLO|nr:hypothetical protein CYMTET_26676 [Cymbomonas tetramitiformis]